MKYISTIIINGESYDIKDKSLENIEVATKEDIENLFK